MALSFSASCRKLFLSVSDNVLEGLCCLIVVGKKKRQYLFLLFDFVDVGGVE